MVKIFVRLVFGGIVGKILGMGREVLLAALFGAGRVVAANRIALTATLIPINFFTADALSAGFLPLFVQYKQTSKNMALILYRSVRTLLAILSTLLAVGLLLGSRVWVDVLGPGLDSGTATVAADMLAIAALGVPFYVQYNLYTLVGLANDDVRLINLRPSTQSVGLICATVAAYFSGHVTLLAWGFTIPYVLLFSFGAWYVRGKGYLAPDDSPLADYGDRPAQRIALGMFWRRLRPLLLIPVILQGSIAVERIVGSLLGVEVVAATEYARSVVDSCMALLAAPLGLAGLAAFSKMGAGEVLGGLRRLIPPVLLISVPISIVLVVDCKQIVTLLYARGRFDDHAVEVSSVLLLGFAIGIWAQVLGYTLIKVLNARGSNSRVAVVTALSFGAAIALNLLMYRHWGAFVLGASATLGGLITLVGAAYSLRILRFTMGLLGILAPGAALAAAAGYLLSGSGTVRLAVSGTATLLVWIAYIFAIPSLRRPLVFMVADRRSKKVLAQRGADAQPELAMERAP